MAIGLSIPAATLVVIVNAAVANGNQTAFEFEQRPGAGNFNALVMASGTFTVCTGALQVSMDGGTTWDNFIAAYDFVATPVQSLTTLVAGPMYRYVLAGFTGTSITLTIAAN